MLEDETFATSDKLSEWKCTTKTELRTLVITFNQTRKYFSDIRKN